MTPTKSSISPTEITQTIKSLPNVPDVFTDLPMQERLVAILADRPARAHITRVLIYSVGEPAVTKDLLEGGMPMHDACRSLDADVQMIEMDTDTTQAEDNARATAFGLMATEESTGLLIVTAVGPQDPVTGDFFATTTPNIAAILGAMVAGAQAKIPVIAEGEGAIAAADVLSAMRPDMMNYVFACEASETASDGPGYAGAMLGAWALAQALEEDAA